MKLTDSHFRKAGARLVRSGGALPSMVRSWCRANALTNRQSRLVVAGARRERVRLDTNRRAIIAAQRATERRLASYRGEVA